MANEDLKQILTDAGVEFRPASNRTQLQKLVDELGEQNAAGGASSVAAETTGNPAPVAPVDPLPHDDTESSGTLPIVRETENAWWCPHCDHSMSPPEDTCVKCHAVRKGDEVTR